MSIRVWCDLGDHPMDPTDSASRGLKVEAAGTVWHLTPVGPRVDVCRPCLLRSIAAQVEAPDAPVIPIRQEARNVR